MKKLTLIFCTVIIGVYLAAASRDYAVLELSGETEVYQAVEKLSDSGISLKHYNERYILADLLGQSPTGAWQRLPALARGEKLYLYTHFGPEKEDLNAFRILWQSGAEKLLAASLKPEEMRRLLLGNYVEIGAAEPVFRKREYFQATERGYNPQISELTVQVNGDSVLAFVQRLEDLQTRYALADNRLEVANTIKSEFERLGLPEVELMPFEWNNTTQYNVVATLPGSKYPDEYVIVAGHHDSITYTTPFDLAPGADDNGSGASAGLEMARVLVNSGFQPECSIRFITFAAEEFGLFGSKHYAETALENEEKIRLMINHDMIGSNYTGQNIVRLMPYQGSESFTALAWESTTLYSDLAPINGLFNSSSSDSYSFWANGYPVVYYFENDFSPFYHSDKDLCIYIDADYMGEVVRASLATALNVAMRPAAPVLFEIHDVGDGQALKLSWISPIDESVSHYQIRYRKNASDEEEQVVQTEAKSIVIEGLESYVIYDFYFSAVSDAGWESESIHQCGCSMIEPRAPIGLRQKPVQGGIELRWDANTELDLAGYRLFRSNQASSLGYQITSGFIFENIFTDYSVQGSSETFYYYTLYAEDTEGHRSPSSLQIHSRPLSLNCGVLIIDESLDYNGSSPFLPTDEMVDEFFDEITAAYPTRQLDLLQHGQPLSLADISVYSSILWHNMDTADASAPWDCLGFLPEYLEAGGNLFYTGYHPGKAFGNTNDYPSEYHDDSFIYKVNGIEWINSKSRPRFQAALPPDAGDYPHLLVDTNKTVQNLNGHIMNVDAMRPAPAAQTVYTYHTEHEADSQLGEFLGEAVGIRNYYGEGQVFTLSLPLYFVEKEAAKSLIEKVFDDDFKENRKGESPESATPALSLSCYPNPFTERSYIQPRKLLPDAAIKIDIYNIRGQLVRRLYEGEPMARLEWDGKDKGGNSVGSGVYFLRFSQGAKSHTQKLLRLRQ